MVFTRLSNDDIIPFRPWALLTTDSSIYFNSNTIKKPPPITAAMEKPKSAINLKASLIYSTHMKYLWLTNRQRTLFVYYVGLRNNLHQLTPKV